MESQHSTWSDQRGQVAILTVSIFMVVFSVLTVGFAYVMTSTVKDSTNDSTSYSARAAAESGVEDAKRLLKYCYSHMNSSGDFDSNQSRQICSGVINKSYDQQTCNTAIDAMTTSDEARNQFGLKTALETAKGGKRIRVYDTTGANKNGKAIEYYQCLKLATRTEDYTGVLTAEGQSSIIQLRLVDKYGNRAYARRVTIQWHNNSTSSNGDKPATTAPGGKTLPKKSDWKTAGLSLDSSNVPAVLRAQFVPVAEGNVSVQKLSEDSRAVTARPTRERKISSWGSDGYRVYGAGDKIDLNDYIASTEPNTTAHPSIAGVAECSKDKPYACTIAFQDIDTDRRDWYLRLNAIYKNAHFRITACKEDEPVCSSNNVLYFDGTQPEVDVTGKSASSYSRIKARLEPERNTDNSLDNWWPDYAIDTAGKVCKDITVRWKDGDDNCTDD